MSSGTTIVGSTTVSSSGRTGSARVVLIDHSLKLFVVSSTTNGANCFGEPFAFSGRPSALAGTGLQERPAMALGVLGGVRAVPRLVDSPDDLRARGLRAGEMSLQVVDVDPYLMGGRRLLRRRLLLLPEHQHRAVSGPELDPLVPVLLRRQHVRRFEPERQGQPLGRGYRLGVVHPHRQAAKFRLLAGRGGAAGAPRPEPFR